MADSIKDILLGDDPIKGDVTHKLPVQTLAKLGVILFLAIFGSIVLANIISKKIIK